MGRKILGYFLFVPALFFSLAILVSLPKAIKSIVAIFSSDDSSYAAGYAFGMILGDLFIFLIAFYCWKKAIKFVKREPIRAETIDDIGKE